MQKVHQVGPNVIAGFAGDIKIGFSVMQTLFRRFHERDPVYVPDEIPPLVAALENDYEGAIPAAARANGCHILVVSTGPRRGVRAGTDEELPWAPHPVYGFKLEMPMPGGSGRVTVTEIPHHKGVSIGSGSMVPSYVAAVEGQTREWLHSVGELAERAGPDGVVFVNSLPGRALTDAIQNTPEITVADQIITAAVIANQVGFATNYEPLGSVTQDGVALPPKVAEFPPIARNMTELLKLANTHGLARSAAQLTA